MEKIVITPEELKSLQDFQTNRNQITNTFGVLEFNIQELELEKSKVVNALHSLKQSELEFTNELQKKYGDGNIDIGTGEFTPR